MLLPIHVSTLDHAIGRFDFHCASDQQMMELLIQDTSPTSQTQYQDRQGGFFDVCEWRGVQCDEKKFVKVIDLGTHGGSLALRYIPLQTKKFRATWCAAEGSLEAESLPRGIETLNLSNNNFSGSCDMESLPEGMKELHLGVNSFGGSLCLESLPSDLVELLLYKNKFSGEISLNNLPATLKWLSVHKNRLQGSLGLEKLPEDLKFLDLSDNNFSGSVNLESLPPALDELSMNDNQLSGSVHLEKLPADLKFLYLNGNCFSGEVHLDSLPISIDVVNISDNALTGTFQILRPLPEGVIIDAKANKFSGFGVVHSDMQWGVCIAANGVVGVVDEHGQRHPRGNDFLYMEHEGG